MIIFLKLIILIVNRKDFQDMKIIKSIDLWTEQHNNHYECFRRR